MEIKMIGRRFNRLVVIAAAESRGGRRFWLCECDCGVQKEISSKYLKNTKSCGCANDNYDDTHGLRPCSKCGVILKFPEEFAPRYGRYAGRHRSYCISCKNLQEHTSRFKKKDWYKKKNRDAAKEIRKRNMLNVISYLQKHPCVDCGEKDWMVLQFDHLRDKKFNISSGIQRYSWNKLIEEIEKCQVRCANCHQKKTIIENNCYAYLN